MKMGIHNKITAERFHQIKGALAVGTSDDEVMRRFKIRKTTFRYVKSSNTYYDYRLRTETLPALKKVNNVVLPKTGMVLIDYLPERKRKRPCDHRPDQDKLGPWLPIAVAIVFIVIMLAMIVGILIKLAS